MSGGKLREKENERLEWERRVRERAREKEKGRRKDRERLFVHGRATTRIIFP